MLRLGISSLRKFVSRSLLKVVITGNTHMRDNYVCVSGVDIKSGQYIRLQKKDGSSHTLQDLQKYHLYPFHCLNLIPCLRQPFSSPPHIEDLNIYVYHYRKKMSIEEIEVFLEKISTESLMSIFERPIVDGRCYSLENPPPRSLGTIELKEVPRIHYLLSSFEEKKVKYRISFKDSSGIEYKNVPIVDLRFRDLLDLGLKKKKEHRLVEKAISDRLTKAKRIFLRVGLTRPFAKSSEDSLKYWLQATGIYPIPDFFDPADYAFKIKDDTCNTR